MKKFEFSWEAPEFEQRIKDVSWYWISIIIAVLVLAFAVWQGNLLFAVFIVIAEILLIFWANKEPRTVSFTLTERGLSVDNGRKFYPMKEIHSFSIDEEIYDDDWPDIHLNFNHHFRPSLRIKSHREHLEDIRTALMPHARQVHHEPSMIDVLEKWIRF